MTRGGWETAEEGLKMAWGILVMAALFFVACAMTAWPIMLTLGSLHHDARAGIPALGFMLTWLAVTTGMLTYAVAVAVGTVVRNVMETME